MASRSFGTGSFGRGNNVYEQQQSEFDVNARRSLDGLGPTKPQLTAEQVKQAYEEALQADEKRTAKTQNADEFVALHSEFLDTAKNGTLMNKMLNSMFGDCAYSVEHYEAAYQALLVTNSLDIDQAEVVKQQQKAIDAQRKAATNNRTDAAARAFNPNANYDDLSLEEIRKRADEETRQQMQRAGERGGNGW